MTRPGGWREDDCWLCPIFAAWIGREDGEARPSRHDSERKSGCLDIYLPASIPAFNYRRRRGTVMKCGCLGLSTSVFPTHTACYISKEQHLHHNPLFPL